MEKIDIIKNKVVEYIKDNPGTSIKDAGMNLKISPKFFKKLIWVLIEERKIIVT